MASKVSETTAPMVKMGFRFFFRLVLKELQKTLGGFCFRVLGTGSRKLPNKRPQAMIERRDDHDRHYHR